MLQCCTFPSDCLAATDSAPWQVWDRTFGMPYDCAGAMHRGTPSAPSWASAPPPPPPSCPTYFPLFSYFTLPPGRCGIDFSHAYDRAGAMHRGTPPRTLVGECAAATSAAAGLAALEQQRKGRGRGKGSTRKRG